jgi:hypothetical protein
MRILVRGRRKQQPVEAVFLPYFWNSPSSWSRRRRCSSVMGLVSQRVLPK